MRKKALLLTVLIAALFVFCSKDDDNITGPGPTPPDDNGDTQTTAFKVVKHAIYEQLPSTVVMQFQVTDLAGKGVDFLTLDRFQVFEEGTLVDPAESSMFLMKKNDVNYVAKTRLLFDNNAGTDLAMLKKAAVEFINAKNDQQMIAIYTVSDQLQLVQDFTYDKSTLVNAVNAIEEGNAAMNLYGGIMEANRQAQDIYTIAEVVQNSLVVFTDSNDDIGAYPIEVVSVANRNRQIYTVGFGANLNSEEIGQIGQDSFYQATDEPNLIEGAKEAQGALNAYFSSFYWLSYQTTLRDGTGHDLELSISGNTNTDVTAKLEGSFSSTEFVDVESGLYVNWSYANPEGVDLVMVMVNDERTIQVLSMGGSRVPSFSYSVENSSVATVQAMGAGRLAIQARGNDGDETKLTIRDTANGLEKEVTIRVVTFQMGRVLYERWENISGTSISNLTSDPRFPDNPDVVEELESWEIESGIGDNYGTRVRGFFHPPQTGKYTFWIASDDASQLLLSTDENPENAVQVCNVSTYTSSREWNKEINQKSDEIELEAGKHYYMETLHNEGTGGDNLAVAWAVDGGDKEVISGDYLSLWIGN